MNKATRDKLQAIKERFDSGPISTLKSELDDILYDYENRLSDAVLGSKPAARLERIVEALGAATEHLDACLEGLDSAQDCIDEACE